MHQRSIKLQNITFNKASTGTIIASGNALESSVSPYFVFPNQLWNKKFLEGVCPWSAREMLKRRW